MSTIQLARDYPDSEDELSPVLITRSEDVKKTISLFIVHG